MASKYSLEILWLILLNGYFKNLGVYCRYMAKSDLWGGPPTPPFYMHRQYRPDKWRSAKSSRATKNELVGGEGCSCDSFLTSHCVEGTFAQFRTSWFLCYILKTLHWAYSNQNSVIRIKKSNFSGIKMKCITFWFLHLNNIGWKQEGYL